MIASGRRTRHPSPSTGTGGRSNSPRVSSTASLRSATRLRVRRPERWSNRFNTICTKRRRRSIHRCNPRRSERFGACSRTRPSIALPAHTGTRDSSSFSGRPSSRPSLPTYTTLAFNSARGIAVPRPLKMKCLAANWLMVSSLGSLLCWNFRYLVRYSFASPRSETASTTSVQSPMFVAWVLSQASRSYPSSKNTKRRFSARPRARNSRCLCCTTSACCWE
mmetsp:Transcript_32005/g.94165  ORF Transcript_32005/g.94165 Transcript_32005/m.94165 type:complete len:221 (+) Transcript_32005:881-1543(+)